MRYIMILAFVLGLVGCGLSIELLRLKASTSTKEDSSIKIIIEEKGDKNENITNGNTTPNGGVFKYYDKNQRGHNPFYYAYDKGQDRIYTAWKECRDKGKWAGGYN